MKKCPKCHKNIPSNAKVCPYCGTPQSGYQPMKRTPKRKYAFIYPILIIALVFLPMGISYFFVFNALSDSGINQTATLKTYTKSNQETVVYQYDSLKEFSKNVKNSKKYVNKINNMESSLEKIVGTKNMDSEYLFQITDNNNIYVSMYGSKDVCKLNEACVEQARYSFTDEQGQPRYMAAEDGKLYVTLSSGNVARLDANTLTFEKMVAVGQNPEHIIEEDGKLYLVNSGFGYDNRLSIIDIKTFDTAEHVEIFQNPDRILEANDKIFIQGYGGPYPDYDYTVAIYDKENKTYKKIGPGTLMAEYNDVVYVIYSETDYNTNTSNHTLYSYNAKTNKKEETSFLQMPEELKTRIFYMLSINPENGDFYVGTTDYNTNGDIYRFKKDGTFIEKFESGGVSPRAAVFID